MKTRFFSPGLALALALLLNHCGEIPQIQPAAVGGVKEIHRTDIEMYYDPDVVIEWDEPTFPLTITCELRDDAGEVVASQMLTYTLPTHTGYITEPVPVMDPISLTWALDAPLEPGIYGEWCQYEINSHYGRSDPGTPVDDRQFYEANEWQAGTCWGVLFRGVDK